MRHPKAQSCPWLDVRVTLMPRQIISAPCVGGVMEDMEASSLGTLEVKGPVVGAKWPPKSIQFKRSTPVVTRAVQGQRRSPGAFHPQRVGAARFPGGQTHPRGQGVPQGLESPLAGGLQGVVAVRRSEKHLAAVGAGPVHALVPLQCDKALFGDAELASAEHMRPLRRGVQGPQGVFFGECPLVQVAPPPRCPHLQGVERLGLGLCMSERQRHPPHPREHPPAFPFFMAGKPLNFALWPHHRR